MKWTLVSVSPNIFLNCVLFLPTHVKSSCPLNIWDNLECVCVYVRVFNNCTLMVVKPLIKGYFFGVFPCLEWWFYPKLGSKLQGIKIYVYICILKNHWVAFGKHNCFQGTVFLQLGCGYLRGWEGLQGITDVGKIQEALGVVWCDRDGAGIKH